MPKTLNNQDVTIGKCSPLLAKPKVPDRKGVGARVAWNGAGVECGRVVPIRTRLRSNLRFLLAAHHLDAELAEHKKAGMCWSRKRRIYIEHIAWIRSWPIHSRDPHVHKKRCPNNWRSTPNVCVIIYEPLMRKTELSSFLNRWRTGRKRPGNSGG